MARVECAGTISRSECALAHLLHQILELVDGDLEASTHLDLAAQAIDPAKAAAELASVREKNGLSQANIRFCCSRLLRLLRRTDRNDSAGRLVDCAWMMGCPRGALFTVLPGLRVTSSCRAVPYGDSATDQRWSIWDTSIWELMFEAV